MNSSVEEKLRKAIAKLINKASEKPSVSSLCEKADISRASFYLYYNDIDDFLDKTRKEIIVKLSKQLDVLVEADYNQDSFKNLFFLDNDDISLLMGFTRSEIYWDFAHDANAIIAPRYEEKMIERFGDKYYENKERLEFILTGSVVTLYYDLLHHDVETFIKDLGSISKITQNFINLE